MRLRCSQGALFLILSVCTPALFAQTSRSETLYFVCEEGTGTVTYVTTIFQATMASFADYMKINDAFRKYVEQETGYKGFPTINYCVRLGDINTARIFREGALRKARMLTRVKLVETNWTYSAQTSNEQAGSHVPAEHGTANVGPTPGAGVGSSVLPPSAFDPPSALL